MYHFSKSVRDRVQVAPILLNNDPLPWVSQVKHLGNVFQNDNSMKVDCTLKRGKFIGKVNSLFQEIHFVKSDAQYLCYQLLWVRTMGPILYGGG